MGHWRRTWVGWLSLACWLPCLAGWAGAASAAGPAKVAPAPAGAGAVGPLGWPQWRGPNRNCSSPESIGTREPVKLWEAQVGYGVSSLIVVPAGGRMGGSAAWRIYAMGHKRDEAGRDVDTIWCLDGASGREVWRHGYECLPEKTSDVRFTGPRSTPACDGIALYALSLAGQLFCLDAATGRVLWSRDIGEGKFPQYGYCSAPLVHGDLLVCDLSWTCVAMKKATGEPVWRAPGGGSWNGAGPVAASFDGVPCIVYGERPVRGARADDGQVLWTFDIDDCATPGPLVAGDRVFLSPFHGKECILLRIAPRGRPEVLWRNDEVQGLCSSAVLWKGHLYAPDRDDLSISPGESGRRMNVKCVEFDTGKVKWVQRPLKWPNILVTANDKLIIQTLDGEIILAEASSDGWREHARADVLRGPAWSYPALAGGRLFCRNNRGDVVCLDVSPRPPAAAE